MRFIWFLLIVGLLVISGCIIQRSLAECEKPGLSQHDKDTCYHMIARAKGSAGDCALIQATEIKNNCNYDIATETENIAVCDRITKNEVAGDTVLCAACKKTINPSLRVNLDDCTTV